MRRTINTTTFYATVLGMEPVAFSVTGALTAGKAKKYAATAMNWDVKQVKLTTPLTITAALYEIADNLVVKYGRKIDAE